MKLDNPILNQRIQSRFDLTGFVANSDLSPNFYWLIHSRYHQQMTNQIYLLKGHLKQLLNRSAKKLEK